MASNDDHVLSPLVDDLTTEFSTTEETVLETAPIDIGIHSADNIWSTSSSMPEEEAPPDAENPEAVEGYADITDEDLEPKIELRAEEDGRFGIMEVVIPPDQRQRVTNTTAWPYRVHGHLIMRFPNGKTYIGSGTMVNRHHVITAGHCVYSHGDGGWAKSIQFNAAQNDANLPFGRMYATRLLSVIGWTQRRKSEFDMGMLILNGDLGRNTGWFGIITGPNSLLLRHRVNVTGYPGDKGGRQLWTMADVIKSVQAERFLYDIDTAGGQSGSGVWSTFQGHQGEKVAGIHTTGSLSGNGATRISRPKFDRIVDWMRRY